MRKSGRKAGIDATRIQILSSTMAHSPASVSTRAVAVLSVSLAHFARPGVVVVSRNIIGIHSLGQDKVPYTYSGNHGCRGLCLRYGHPIWRNLAKDTYTRPRRNVTLIEILCVDDAMILAMNWIGRSSTIRSSVMVMASLVRNSAFKSMQWLRMDLSQDPWTGVQAEMPTNNRILI